MSSTLPVLEAADTPPGSRTGRRGMERAFWVVSLIILFSDAVFVYVNYRHAQAVLYETLEAEGARQETTFRLNLRNQGLHMQQFATYMINQPGVRELFLAGRRAVLEEGGGSGGPRAAAIRQQLFARVAPGWRQVSGRYQARQAHFHLGPGDVSFLRVHKPDKFGDDLSAIRHTITHAIRDNRRTHGFESGRVYSGIRGVVPIETTAADGTPVVAGALEAGSSFAQMLKSLATETGTSYTVLLSNAYFHDTHWPKSAAKLKEKNPLADGWYIEGSSNQPTVRALLQEPAVKRTLGARDAVISRTGGVPLAVYSFPFRDFLRTAKPDLAPIGAIITWRDASAELGTADSALQTNLVLGVAGFLIVETLLFSAWNLARRKLQARIDGQVADLSATNRELHTAIALREQSEQRLKDYQARLETLVDDRTRSLSATVDALELEAQQRHEVEHQLQRQRDLARVTLRSIADGVITTNVDGRVVYLNPAAENLTGWSLADAPGRMLDEVFPARDMEHDGRTLGFADCLAGRCPQLHGENTELLRRDGRTVVVEHSISPIRDEAGNHMGLVLVFHDDTEARNLAVQLSHQASHDALTGLANRRAIEIELEDALQSSREGNDEHAFLYIDLDQFKVVNDTCGHIAGDELLRQVGKLIQQQTRHSDRLARVGGDEFGLLLRDCRMGKAGEIAEELLDALRGFRFVWDERSFKIGASIGVSPIEHHSESIQSVLSQADAACYLAKEKGRCRVQLSLPDDQELALRRGEMNWVSRIQLALQEDRLVLFGQPIVPVSPTGGETPHQEVLVRMLGENGELIPPTAFIPAAERYGMMHDVDRWIVERTFRFIHQAHTLWPDEPASVYSVNLSGETMADAGILDFIREQLKRYAIDPHQVCFEVTETAAIANLASAIDLMAALKNDGCRFALDDFGSGLSSFGYLKALPVDYLKIDGAFVKQLDASPVDRVLVQAIHSVGHSMNLKTIAEFVENEAILAELRTIGIDYAQGYGVGRPSALW